MYYTIVSLARDVNLKIKYNILDLEVWYVSLYWIMWRLIMNYYQNEKKKVLKFKLE